MTYRMSVKLDARGYGNMIGTEYEGCGLTPGFTFFNMKRGHQTKVEMIHKAEKKDEIFDGVFYDKDCYMFLLTEKKPEEEDNKPAQKVRGGSPFNWKIFVWKGAKASLIQFGFAGTKANDLQKKLVENGNYYDCEVIKEIQGSESDQFKALFTQDIVMKTGNRIRTDVHTEGDAPVEKVPKLYEVKQDRLNRIPIRRDCIKDNRNYILDIGTAVYSYSGPKCGRVERAYTEEMARRRCKADYRKKVKAKHVALDDKEMVDLFHKSLDENEQPAWPEWEEHFDPVLFTVDISNGQLLPIENTRADTNQENPGEEKHFLFDADMLQKKKIFVLDCLSEIFVWIGKGINHNQQNEALTAVSNLKRLPGRPSFLSVEIERQNMETVFFKERFFGFDQTDLLEIGGTVRNIKSEQEFLIYAKDEEPKTRRVSGELKRVVQFLEEREKDFVAEQALHLANDASGRLIAFKYDQKGNMQRMEPWEYGFFETTKMYAYVYSCKNDTMHYVFTWEGEHASVRAKTVAGISTTGKEIPGLTEEMMGTKVFKFISQGKEPRLLTYLLEKRNKHLFLRQGMPTERQRNQGAIQEVFLDGKLRKVYAFVINEIGNFGARTCEIPFRTLKDNGFYKKSCYLIYRGPLEKQNMMLHANLENFVPTEIFYYVGEYATESCEKLVRKLANDPVLPRSFGFQDFASLEVFNMDLNDPNIKEKYWDEEELNLHVNEEELLPEPTRPTRLFSISHTLKEVGGMFIHDIGDGIFSQIDLKQNEVFLLDTGSTVLYLWIGSGCSNSSIKLGIESATMYCSRMLPTLKQYRDKGQDFNLDVTLKLVDSGEESMAFKSCFYGWKNFSKSKKNLASKFEKSLAEYFELAQMSDTKRKMKEEKQKMALRAKKLQIFKNQKTLHRSRMKTLKKGKLVAFKRNFQEISVIDKVGDRIQIDDDSQTITVNRIGKRLRIFQNKVTIDELCKHVKDGAYDWVLFQYENVEDVSYVCRGSNGTDELMQNISERVTVDDEGKDTGDNVFYAMLNIKGSELVTKLSRADRLLFISFTPETTKPILRAAVNVHRSFMAELLGPFFHEIIIRDVDELNHQKAVAIASKGQ